MTTTLHSSPAFSDFLEQPSVRAMQVSVVPSSGGTGTSELMASTSVGLSTSQGTSATAGVVFTKCSADMLTAENISSAVMMTTLSASPLQSLQLSIRQLYAPMLLQDPQWASKLDAETRRTLGALDSALESAVQLGERTHSEDDFSNIMTPHDECQHWKMIDAGRMPSATADQRARARTFWDALRPIADQLAAFYEQPPPEMVRLLRELQSTLDGLFQSGYPAARMLHLLRVVGSSIDGYVKKRLADLRVWTEPYRKVSKSLRDMTQLVDGWVADVAQLTGVFWPQMGAWKSGAFTDELLAWLRSRIGEILEMRAVVHQLSLLARATDLRSRGSCAVAGINRCTTALLAPAWRPPPPPSRRPWCPSSHRRAHANALARRAQGHAPSANSRATRSSCGASGLPELAPARETLLGQLEQQLDHLREDWRRAPPRSRRRPQGDGWPRAPSSQEPPEVVEHLAGEAAGEKVFDILAAGDPGRPAGLRASRGRTSCTST